MTLRLTLLSALLGATCTAAHAQEENRAGASPTATPTAPFEQCMADLGATARAEGISDATVQTVFADIQELPRVIASDREQPEFTQTFTEYYDRRVTQRRVDEGRRLLNKHAQLLRSVQAQTGVPPHYLVALWGLETNFGAYFGTLYIPSALATLACDDRRPDFFRRELLAVLQIVDRGDRVRAEPPQAVGPLNQEDQVDVAHLTVVQPDDSFGS